MPIQNEAIASYTGIGRRQIIETVTWQVPWPRNVDPLAQTFTLTEDRFITAVGLFFGGKDAAKPVTVQIRNVVNGYPGAMVLVSKTLRPTEVNVTADGSIETKATFDEPVLLFADTEYAIVVVTDADQYRVAVARMAESDMISGAKVARQPYTIGVLFSSSNATAWTAHQEMDLKFKLYGAVFDNEAILQYNSVVTSDVGQLVLAVGQLVPRGCAILWQWSPDGAQWFPLADGDVTNLSAVQASVTVRAILRKGGKCSPVVHYKSALMVGMSYKSAGVYVTKNFSFPSFTDIAVYVDHYTPSGTTQALEYSVDDGENWIACGAAASSQQIDEYFTQYKFTVHLGVAATQLRIRVNLTGNNALITSRSKRLMIIVS